MKFGFGYMQLPHLAQSNLSESVASTSFNVVFCEKAPDQVGRSLSSEIHAGPVLGILFVYVLVVILSPLQAQ